MWPILRVLAFLPMIAAAKIRREERWLAQSFRARGAVDADHAVALPVDGRLRTWVRDRLVRGGVIKPARDGVYLEESGYTAFRRRRRHRAALVVTVVLLGLAVAFFSGDVSL